MTVQLEGGRELSRLTFRPKIDQLWTRVRSLRPFVAVRPWPGGAATALRHPPERLIQGDAQAGNTIYSERRSAKDIANFNQLDWLRHLTASAKTLHAIYAAGLLVIWADKEQPRSKGADAAQALIALATDATVLPARMRGFLTDLLPMVDRQARRVHGWTVTRPDDKVLKGTALLTAAVAFTGLENLREPAAQLLAEGLDGTVQPDGGHVSRSPDELLKLMLLLVPLRRALDFAHDPVPPALHMAIERMMPMLRMLSHGDGGMVRFQSAKPNPQAVAAILRTDHTMGECLDIAPHSRVARLEQNRFLLLADYGDAALPFEASWREARLFGCRSDSGRALHASPAEIHTVKGGRLIRLSASAANSNGTITRTIFVAEAGNDMRCEDQLAADGFLLFTFADDVSVLDVGLSEVRLMAGDKSLWTIKQRGGLFELGAEFQRTIKLEPDDPTRAATINWAVKKFASN